MRDQLDNEFDYYIEHQDELVDQYDGQVIVIKNRKVIGNYATIRNAIVSTSEEHKPGTFLVHRCGPGKENYTIKVNSRLV